MDTNLLMLLIVGAYDRDQVERTRRIRDRFRAEDFDILTAVLDRFDTRVTTPHVLTETSNLLAQQLSGYVKNEVFSIFARLVSTDWYERSEAASVLVEVPSFPRLGLTDVAISEAARNSYLVLTDDAPLANHLGRLRVDVLNFTYLRGL
ncbi:MAG: hypothetical protein WA990_04100 [Rubrobacteraceae bacterium]